MIFSDFVKETAFSILDKSKFRGFHLFRDLRFYADRFNLSAETIFDVGANIGQTSMELKNYFSTATIHAFEPIDATFEILKDNLCNSPNIILNNLALGTEEKQTTVLLTDNSLTNSLLREVANNDGNDGLTQRIDVTTGDRYCERNNINSIFLLKTDAEGYDLAVLQGVEKNISAKKIFFILAEVTFDKSDSLHTQFDEIHQYLSDRSYTISNIYDSIHHRGFSPNLHYCNCLWSLSPE
jgi:FkbM family methyltransferase